MQIDVNGKNAVSLVLITVRRNVFERRNSRLVYVINDIVHQPAVFCLPAAM